MKTVLTAKGLCESREEPIPAKRAVMKGRSLYAIAGNEDACQQKISSLQRSSAEAKKIFSNSNRVKLIKKIVEIEKPFNFEFVTGKRKLRLNLDGLNNIRRGQSVRDSLKPKNK